MNILHREILKQIKENADSHLFDNLPNGYLGTTHPLYGLKTPVARRMVRQWAKDHKDLTIKQFEELLNSLYLAPSSTEKIFASLLLFYMPKLRKKLNPKILDIWLEHLEGWAEIDALCQSNFTAEELMSNWTTWKKLLLDFTKSKYISKRRASLVLLTKTVHESPDRRLADLAFQNILKLQTQKEILITKAISWLLRDLTYRYPDEVKKFLQDYKNTLPKIAIRETIRKLETGKK